MKRQFEQSVQDLNRLTKDVEIKYTCDCFVTSEVAYSQVLQKLGPKVDFNCAEGGYIGVGPCQNFTYLGHLKSSYGLIVDGRVDNMLEHLIFKALFIIEPSRFGYLCRLFGRLMPPWLQEEMATRTHDVADFLDLCPSSLAVQQETLDALAAQLTAWDLSPQLRARCEQILGVFFSRQLTITSVSADALLKLNRIPSYREILVARTCQQFNFHMLSSDESYEWVRRLQMEDRIIPVVDNICSESASWNISQLVEAAGSPVSCIYLANLEEFLVERYRIEADVSINEPNPGGYLTGEFKDRYDALLRVLQSFSTSKDCMLIRFFFPGEIRGRRFGMHPWLEAHVTFLDTYLERISHLGNGSIMESYL
jgi:hypothetical protein